MEMEFAYDVKWETLSAVSDAHTVDCVDVIKREISHGQITSMSMMGLSWRRGFSCDVSDVIHSIR